MLLLFPGVSKRVPLFTKTVKNQKWMSRSPGFIQPNPQLFFWVSRRIIGGPGWGAEVRVVPTQFKATQLVVAIAVWATQRSDPDFNLSILLLNNASEQYYITIG
jgi:hypothetical protein